MKFLTLPHKKNKKIKKDIYIYMYIYIYREREREREREMDSVLSLVVSINHKRIQN